MNYTINKAQLVMAKGFAIGGARASSKCRFNGRQGNEIITLSKLEEWARDWKALPSTEEKVRLGNRDQDKRRESVRPLAKDV